MILKQFWDITTGKNSVQTFVQISHLYVVKMVSFAQKFAIQTHFSKAWFFMKMASSETVLRLRSTFLVPNGYL